MSLFHPSGRSHALAILVAFGTIGLVGPAVAQLKSLGTDAVTSCTKCEGELLPGGPVPVGLARFSIHSDLPEIFHTPGVLYTTRPILPPFDTFRDGPLEERMRTQRSAPDFEHITGDFEVFLYHMTEPGYGKAPRRIGVLVENVGQDPVTIQAGEIMESTGKMAGEDGPEMRLTRRYHHRDFRPRYRPVTIQPGAVELIALTPRFGDGLVSIANDPVPEEDRSVSKFVTGQVLAQVDPSTPKPKLHVHVVGMDAPVAGSPDGSERDEWTKRGRALLDRGAKSGETYMDLRIEPPPCHVRRVAGVYETFRWEGSATVTYRDIATTDVRFLMALPAAQATTCPEAVQTQQLLRWPPYVRPETIGNYMVMYLVHLTLDNSQEIEDRDFDLRFGKQDASIGLSWQVASGTLSAEDEAWKSVPLQSGWAGAWTKGDLLDNTEPFSHAPVRVEAGQTKKLSFLFTVAGTSSLPFQVHVSSQRPERSEP